MFVNNLKKYIQLYYYTFIGEHNTKYLFVKLILIYLNQNFLTSIDIMPARRRLYRDKCLIFFFFYFHSAGWIEFNSDNTLPPKIQCIHILQLHYLKAFRIFRAELNFGGILIVPFSTSLAWTCVGCLWVYRIWLCTGGCLTLNRSKNDRHQRNNRWQRRKIKIH